GVQSEPGMQTGFRLVEKCKPSCRARKPNRENVIFYDTKEVAIKNRFRACEICKP
ncbi:MAG: hypothetical protein GY818_05430, partial [Planctomycetaceae bacterium]|nr:hypothetical protein [Planctomycetaceae bacterium]